MATTFGRGRHRAGLFTLSVEACPFEREPAHREVLVSENMGLYSAYVNLAEDERFLLFGPDPRFTRPPEMEEEHAAWTWRRGTAKSPITQPLWRLSIATLQKVWEACLFESPRTLFRRVQAVPTGSRFREGDPVLIPSSPDHRRGAFAGYKTHSGPDRKVEVTVGGAVVRAWESYVLPDMASWSRMP